MRNVLKIFTFSVVLCYLLVSTTVHSLEELYIQHAPSYMKFTPDIVSPHLKTSQIPDLISAAIGFTTTEDLHWKGMKAGNPLKRPKAIVVVEFDGFEKVDLALNYVKYPLVVDVPPSWGFQVIGDRIYQRFPDQELTLLDITNDDSLYAVKSQYPHLLQSVSVDPFSLEKDLFEENLTKGNTFKSLNITYTPDLGFMLDMQLFQEVTDALRSKAKFLQMEPTVNLIWLHSSMLQGLISVYGSNSAQVAEAVQIIRERLMQTENDSFKIYKDAFLMLVMTVNYQSLNSKTRLTRSLQGADSGDSTDHNIAETYDEDYPAIFNIIFLTCLIIGLSVFAIALGMWHMDPGRDSIIYRMTSQRIKKDQ